MTDNRRIVESGFLVKLRKSDNSKPARDAILITPELCGTSGYVFYTSGGMTDQLYPGDYFVITNRDQYKGYRLSESKAKAQGWIETPV